MVVAAAVVVAVAMLAQQCGCSCGCTCRMVAAAGTVFAPVVKVAVATVARAV